MLHKQRPRLSTTTAPVSTLFSARRRRSNSIYPPSSPKLTWVGQTVFTIPVTSPCARGSVVFFAGGLAHRALQVASQARPRRTPAGPGRGRAAAAPGAAQRRRRARELLTAALRRRAQILDVRPLEPAAVFPEAPFVVADAELASRVTALAGSDGRGTRGPAPPRASGGRVDAARGARPCDDCASSAKARILSIMLLGCSESPG